VSDTVISDILTDDGELPDEADPELEIERERIGEVGDPEETKVTAPPPPPQYVFPPLELLREEEVPPAADEAELRTNAKKLVDTLLSFNVKTKVVNISKGPTITRYELQPEAGTRVRSIANLVDDIALSLASSGVRIEAPIPGKSAVGIEVPNKQTSMVCLRGLLDTPQFSAATSKLTVALGRDVVGSPMYLDLAKMPHLLIAGATGSGKSVCINSIIISLLYKARPDEVKLILIDPKKVELNVYNGLPHLLVPVVSDPKKAAGSLSWAVTEMERRFELIEEVGAREIKGYNSITAKDPEKEFLPQIVIVIDELADLMMTASKDVETYICRIAQKARAAGMHLIIGTQRPSVDVITGLIKANVPSRIAFTTSNQVDSRTIIDMAGAEKLMGRGDMLSSPIGASKPMRGQGSFVSDEEVEKITDFIKKTSGGPVSYSDEVIASIERAAELCGVKKGELMASTIGEDDGEGGGDPMLRAALELAVDSGKISTSLIQRKLSLGYGRAAKLIDRMEELGYVSEPEGQKPREVLITKEQFMEMVLKDADIQ
ncbi:MAG: DNA translocase FtsK, partial [Clostridia bacterium]|nr:DNA translocase FtsK [Clostridia bacterium]